LLVVALSFFTRREFKFYSASRCIFERAACSVRRALGVPLRLGLCGIDAAHSGIDAPSADGICTLCGRHPHFNAPKMRDSGACFDDTTTPVRPYD